MEPPKLIRKPPQQFFDVQTQFMQRGFLEMKDWLKQKVQQHFSIVKQKQHHRVQWDIELEPIEIDHISLFTVNGEELNSFKDIKPDCKAIIISTDTIFRGLQNTLRPKEISKQRILQEKNTRNIYKELKQDFSEEIKCTQEIEWIESNSHPNIQKYSEKQSFQKKDFGEDKVYQRVAASLYRWPSKTSCIFQANQEEKSHFPALVQKSFKIKIFRKSSESERLL